MKLDIRTPMGVLFLIIGAILIAAGLMQDVEAARLLNCKWGGALLVFGGVCLALALLKRRGTPPQ